MKRILAILILGISACHCQSVVECNQNIFKLANTNEDNYASFSSPIDDNTGLYPSETRCVYKFRVPANKEVVLRIKYLDIRGNEDNNCRGDFLAIVVGDNLPDKKCGQYEEIEDKVYPAMDVKYRIKFVFKSNKRREGRGFLAHIFLKTTSSDEPTNGDPDTSDPSTGGESQCGVGLSNRIVGGQEADANSIPWQVALTGAGSNFIFCGGTLISKYHVLTAAHCTDGSSASELNVLVGEHDTTITGDGAVRHQVNCINDHPNYDGEVGQDYSILTLKDPVDIGPDSLARTACLPSDKTNTYAGQSLTVSGWGTLSSQGSSPDVLHHVQVPCITNSECRNSYGSFDITDFMMCAGQPEGGIDSCQGDSGGPLTHEENGITTVVGVVSWGIGCAEPGNPGVYARVTTVLDWINSFDFTSNVCSA